MPLTGDNWSSLGSSLVGGLTGLLGSQNNLKSAQAQADAMRENAQAQREIALLNLQNTKLQSDTALALAQAKPQSDNKMLYIALGIGGVVVLGVVIFAVTRKK